MKTEQYSKFMVSEAEGIEDTFLAPYVGYQALVDLENDKFLIDEEWYGDFQYYSEYFDEFED